MTVISANSHKRLRKDAFRKKSNGNVLNQTIWVLTVGQASGFTAVKSYSYDALNRLKQATENVTPNGGSQSLSWQQTYTFDRYGNRNFDEANTTTLPKECTESGNPVVCEAIRPIVNPSVNTANNRLNDYTFDPAGNTTVDAEGRTFTYDAENKQVKVKDSQNQTIGEYFYNGDGLRIKKVVPSTGETTIFVYDASNRLVAEYSTQTNSNPTTSYLTNDNLGSPRVITDSLGQVISRRDFMRFGEELYANIGGRTENQKYTQNGVDNIRKRFTSYELDNETELDFAQARMYANRLGRFTSPDPVNTVTPQKLGDVQQQNLYAYARNNPLRFVDPSGMIIKPRNLTDDERKQWDETVRLANLQDDDGNYVHPELHALYAKLDGDSRTFYIDGEDLGKGTAGRFDVETFTADGKDFTEASIKINFGLLNDIRTTTTGDFDKSFEKLAGLFGDKDSPIRRIAEIFSHEASHAEFALNNPADAVKLQIFINDSRPGGETFERWKQYSLDKSKIKKSKDREKFLPPPDLVEKQATKDSMLQATEKYAQERENVFNLELQNSKKK